MKLPAPAMLLMAVSLWVPGICYGSERMSLEPLGFNDEIHDCELMLYPADSPDAPSPKLLQIPLYERPVAVSRRQGRRQELKIDKASWQSLSTYDLDPGRNSIELSGDDISITVTFTRTRGASCYVSDGTCMYDLSDGLVEIVTPHIDKERINVSGAIGC